MSGERARTRQMMALIAGLAAGGVRQAVAAPGSRSTPLTILLHRYPGIRLYMHYDERAAAYFALGLARRSGRPVPVVVTSGTAVANLLPAATEASLASVPVILLTADRPPELQDVGAAQTMPQRDVFRPVVKWSLQLAAVDGEADYADQAAMAGLRAARLAMETPRGPVHINVPLREPLLPVSDETFPAPAPAPTGGENDADARILDAVVTRVEGPSGVIVAGATDLAAAAPGILRLAEHLGWPVLADPLSNLRQSGHPAVLAGYDAWLRHHPPVPPAWVIRFGAPATSKALDQWTRGARRLLVDERERWRDAGQGTEAVFWVDRWEAVGQWSGDPGNRKPPRTWWRSREDAAQEALDQGIAQLPGDFEGWAFRRWSHAWRGYRAIMVGSSMPVRDLDSFWRGSPADPPVFANRGANGIDGVMSTGLGMALVDAPVGIVLGDLSFWHDVNGLGAAVWHDLHASVLVINNAGGGIFSFLAQRDLPDDEFEPLFGTPHTFDLAGAAQMVGARFLRADDWGTVETALQAARETPGLTVVEWRTAGRRDNVEYHRRLWDRVAEATRDLAVGD
jgi:2-succinyl-5-enolpyruvyl-6-hydroxy-3-cyclohexene-1-carboxylate synthase